MSVTVSGDIQESQIFYQGDGRDPLGVWGARVGATGDASAGVVKAIIGVPALRRASYVYTCYSLTGAITSGSISTTASLKTRLLTNWPDVEETAGLQAYSTLHFSRTADPPSSTFPTAGPIDPMLDTNTRFLLLFDPRANPTLGRLELIEIEYDLNVNGNTYSFEAWGYFWDRGVLSVPGGLRHPGSS